MIHIEVIYISIPVCVGSNTISECLQEFECRLLFTYRL